MVTIEDTRVITKEGTIKEYNTTCKECATEFKYTSLDVKSGKITCPLCYTVDYHMAAKPNGAYVAQIKNKPKPRPVDYLALPWET